jgi:hypothetical protein
VGRKRRPARGQGRPGDYVVDDQGKTPYIGTDIHEALAVMRRSSDNAVLYRIDEDEEGMLERIRLAFRKGAPVPTVVPF